MRTLILGDEPEVDAWLDRRRALGHDGRDETWEGVYHVAPRAGIGHARVALRILMAVEPAALRAGLTSVGEFNLGLDANDYRVPDGGWLREPLTAVYAATAAAVLEVLSPGDETFAKFDFYAGRGVQDLLVADPQDRSVRCWTLTPQGYQSRSSSAVLGVATSVMEQIDWP